MNLNEEKINELLSIDEMYLRSELHSIEMSDNGNPHRNIIKEQSFEMGFMCARKKIIDYLRNNEKI